MNKIQIPENANILIIAPHPDDELFCCSGVLLGFPEKCNVILLTDGRDGNLGWGKIKTAKIRQSEFEHIMKEIGIKSIKELKISDGKVENHLSELKKIPLEKYSHIFLPNRFDIHKDHKCIYKVIKEACIRKMITPYIFEYEMWGMLRNPNYYFDISGIMDQKIKYMHMYKSQQIHIDYCGRIKALNYYRAIEVSHAEYIECFYKNEKDVIDLIIKKLRGLKTINICGRKDNNL